MDLGKECSFGELGMITGKPRCLSAKARDFTDVLCIYKDDFFRLSDDFLQSARALKEIRDASLKNDLKPIGMSCYICDATDHIATKCEDYKLVKGNLVSMWFKLSNEDKSLEEITRERKAMQSVNEAEDNKLYPSAESDDDVNLKEQLVREHIK